MSDLVSVIIPTFNRGHYLVEALASVVDQTYRPLEIVVVDDGSEDDDLGLVKGWWGDLPETHRKGCRLILLGQANGGPSKARNRGLIETTGEFVQFLDSDDLLYPEKIERQMAALADDASLGYVFSSLRSVQIESGQVINQGPVRVGPDSFDVGRHISLGDSLQTSVGLYRRKTCDQIGPWNESLTVGEDIEYNLRLILHRIPAAYVDGCFVSLRNHGGPRASRGAGPEKLVRAFEVLERLVREHATAGERESARPWFAYAYSRVGFESLVSRQPTLASMCLRRAWQYAASVTERFKVICLWGVARMPLSADAKAALARSALRLAPYRRVWSRFFMRGKKVAA